MKPKKALLFFLVLSLFLTFPLFFSLFSAIPGQYADTYQVWGKALEFRNLIKDQGVWGTLAWQAQHFRFTPVEAIGWVQWLVTPFLGYNLVWLFSFVMAGWGMFILTRYLTGNAWAGLMAGVIFAFSPFHFSQAVSTNIGTMHLEWLPFFVFFLIRFLRQLRFWDFLGTIAFLVLIALSEHQLLAFTLVLAVLVVVFFLIKNYQKLKEIRFWGFFLGGSLALFLAVKLIFGGLFLVTESTDNYLDPGSDQVRRYSSDAIDFFLPAKAHPFWGERFNYLREETEANSTGRQSVYIGYVVFLLGLVSVIFGGKKRLAIRLFFFFNALFFAILALGPLFHWQGKVYDNWPMPYTFLYEHIPYWYIIRTVNRIFVVANFCFAVSAGFGLSFVLGWLVKDKTQKAPEDSGERLEKEAVTTGRLAGSVPVWIKKQRLWFGLFLGLVILEYLFIALPTLSLKHSAFYERMAAEPEMYSVLDIPGATSYDYGSKLMFYNQIHRKNNLAQMDFARVIEDNWDFQKNTPVINDLLYSLPTGGKPPSKEIVNDDYYALATKILNHYHIKYLIVSKDYLAKDKQFDGPAFENTLDFIEGQINTKKAHEDNFLVAYKVEPSDHLDGWFLALILAGDKWGKKEGVKGSTARWARDGAEMRLVNMDSVSKNIRLSFSLSIKSLNKVEIYLNQVKQIDFTIKKEKENHVVALENVLPGENTITIRIFDLEGEPVEDLELKKGVKFFDVRTLAPIK